MAAINVNGTPLKATPLSAIPLKATPLSAIPPALADWPLTLKPGGAEIEYVFDGHDEHTGIPALLRRLDELGIECRDLQTRQSSLEEIFVSLVHRPQPAAAAA